MFSRLQSIFRIPGFVRTGAAFLVACSLVIAAEWGIVRERIANDRATAVRESVVVGPVLAQERFVALRARERDYYIGAAAITIFLLIAAAGLLAVLARQQQAAEDKRRSDARYRAIFDQAPVGIVHGGLDGRCLMVNPHYCRMLGYREEEIVGRHLAAFLHPDDLATTQERFAELMRNPDAGHVPEVERRFVRKDGSLAWVASTVSLARDQDGAPAYLVGVAQDITQRKQAEEKLEHQAYYDALTDLPNRSLCYDRLTLALAHARRTQWSVGVLFVDLDRFKAVNDSLGNAIGDALLRQAAQRLQKLLRASDTIARFGGDEFVVVLPDLATSEDAAIIARKLIAALAVPFCLDGQEIFVTGSIGIATSPPEGCEADVLVRNADAAMTSAKRLGRANFQFYTAAMNERAMEKLLLEGDLRRALERNEFVLHFQPKVLLATGEVTGFEALIRWNRPGKGLVSPAQFIPVLEESALIVPVGEWVIDAACAQLRAWQDAGLEPVPVAVNLAVKQFLRHDIVATIERALRAHDIDASLLEVEITESDAMQNPDEVVVMLRTLRERRIRVSIDDFGTGYSSLGYLKRLPIDALKLDRSFVMGLPDAADDASIARAVLAMAHSLGLKVIAEGVETKAQRAFLAANGCDQMQGYLFSRPLPAAECVRFLLQPAAAPESATA